MPYGSRSHRRVAVVSAALLLVVCSADAHAGESARVETLGGSVGLIVGQIERDHAELGLVIALKPGWKTYWRTPGDAGIPPRLALSGTTASELKVDYPLPHRFGPVDAPSLGYSDTVTLPMTVRLTDPAQSSRVVLSVMLGVCNDICVPVTESLAVDVRRAASPLGAKAIAAARRAVPAPVTAGSPLAVAGVQRADAAEPAIEVVIDPGPDGPVKDVFVEAGTDWALAQPNRLGDDGNRTRWRIVLSDAPGGRPVTGAMLTLTIAGARTASEQRIAVPDR